MLLIRRWVHLWGWCICLMATDMLCAQVPRFKSLNDEVGFPNTIINDVFQDSRGFMWLASWDGLYRYDGYNVEVYRRGFAVGEGPSSNKITYLHEDRAGNLWIGTRIGGVNQYHVQTATFSTFDQSQGLSNNNVWAIEEDSEGNIWVGTEAGLNRIDPTTGQIQAFVWDEHPDQNFINSITIIEGLLWIGSEGGLFRWDPQNANKSPYKINLTPKLGEASLLDEEQNNYVYHLHRSHTQPHLLWVGTKGGLKQIDISDLRSSHFGIQHLQFSQTGGGLSDNVVPDFQETTFGGDTVLWLATYHGLNRLDLTTGEISAYFADRYQPESLNNNRISTLCVDQSGILWIGSDKGINKLNLMGKPFHPIRLDQSNDPSKNIVTDMVGFSRDEFMWVSASGGGISRLKEQTDHSWQIKNYVFGDHLNSATVNFVADIALDDDENLWVCTKGEGILRVPYEMWQQSSHVLSGYDQFSLVNGAVLDDHVMASFKTLGGELWFGHWDGGIDCYLPESDEFVHFSVSSDGKVNFREFPNVVLFESTFGDRPYLWVGSRGGGLFQMSFDPTTQQLNLVKHYVLGPEGPGHISDNFIGDIYQDSKGNLWVGTEDGLNVLASEGDYFRYVGKDNGLANQMIKSIMEDNHGQYWIGTYLGLFRMSAKADQWEVQPYYREHGLQDNIFANGGVLKDRNGRLFIGGVNGLNWFYPEAIRPDTIAPQVALVDLRLFNRSIAPHETYDERILIHEAVSELSSVSLSHRDRVISIAFTGMHYGQPAKNQYAYKLEGFDEDWVYTDAQHRIAHYTNLPYKDYVFQVKAANADGTWNETPAVLHIHIAPPWWLTPMAKLGYVLLFIGLLWGVRRITLMRVQFQNRLAMVRLEREKLAEVDRLKTEFFTNVSHELRTPLTLILAPLEDLVKEKIGDLPLRETFHRMHRNGQRLLTMINQILDLQKNEAGLVKLEVAEGDMVKFVKEIALSFKTLAGQGDIHLSFEAEDEPIFVWYDRDQMEKVCFNLLSNALKFTPKGGAVTVNMWEDRVEKRVGIRVQDSGVGIPEKELAHVFDRFYQVAGHQQELNRNGSGIGLALSKVIIEHHHGYIEVESAEGRGTSFTFFLPLGGKHFSEAQKITHFKNSEDKRNYVPVLPPNESNPVAPQPELAKPAPLEKGYTLLIVEDNHDIRAYLRSQLEKAYHILEAADGQSGLAIALEKVPDLIISDISMPVMDGIEFCRRIKSDLQTSHVPVILLTARTSLIFQIDGYETGADDYVTKPFKMELLRSRIMNLIKTRENLRGKFSQGGYELSPSQVAVGSLDEQFLQNVILEVERHMDDPEFTVEIMGRELAMSRMQLYRKLKALTGESPNQVIRKIRLKRAAQLLETQQFTVAEVTYQVGFQDLKYFRERFKKEYGVSPSAYVNSRNEGPSS